MDKTGKKSGNLLEEGLYLAALVLGVIGGAQLMGLDVGGDTPAILWLVLAVVAIGAGRHFKTRAS